MVPTSRLEQLGVRRSPGQFLLVVLGLTALLTLGDQFHVQFGVISYATTVGLAGQAWWVAPGFALATMALVAAAWPLSAFMEAPSRRDLARETGWFFAAYATSGIYGHKAFGLACVFFGVWLYRIAKRPDRRVLVAFSIVLAIAGTLGEIALHATGVCRYTLRQIVLVPLWLPMLYMQGAPLALAVARWMRGDDPMPDEDEAQESA